jgi:hypothetical protein
VDSQESIAQLNAETKLVAERMKANGKERPPLTAFEQEE